MQRGAVTASTRSSNWINPGWGAPAQTLTWSEQRASAAVGGLSQPALAERRTHVGPRALDGGRASRPPRYRQCMRAQSAACRRRCCSVLDPTLSVLVSAFYPVQPSDCSTTVAGLGAQYLERGHGRNAPTSNVRTTADWDRAPPEATLAVRTKNIFPRNTLREREESRRTCAASEQRAVCCFCCQSNSLCKVCNNPET